MKNITIALIILLAANVSHGQKNDVRINKYKLKGRIINHLDTIINIDSIPRAMVIELRILEFSDTTYKEDSIGVIFKIKKINDENFFKTGEFYELILTDEKEEDTYNYIYNEYLLQKYRLNKRLWIIKARVIE